MMHLYKSIDNILKHQPETWLAYLHGQQLRNMPHLTRTPPLFRGLWLQLVKFFLIMLRLFSFRRGLDCSTAKFLFFCGSLNQQNSLNTTIESLKNRGESIVIVSTSNLARNEEADHYLSIRFSFLDICNSLILLVKKGPALYRELNNIHPVAVSWYFSNFCSVYLYLCYFYRVLESLRPEFVVTANDHSAPNRCMLAVACELKIKTVYMQHASVSNLFPALQVHYAFLDGQYAMDIYQNCVKNRVPSDKKPPNTKILLTGQKKTLTRSFALKKNIVGVALNALDHADDAIKLVKKLLSLDLTVRLRWHPGQSDSDIKKYLTAFRGEARVSLSNPVNEPVAEFMGKIGWLVAGNSSIHLEAALSGVIPIYYTIAGSDLHDYYGYVRHGLASLARTPEEIIKIVNETNDTYNDNIEPIRYYSSTYLTEWDGKEGQLVAECLVRISRNQSLPIEMVSLDNPTSKVSI
ncbi:hypothetical protein LKR43_14495 [Pusillimonas sp. MFBS29]|uniref:hypothetical protein n=1 Tax=Pusillimonas sp. MFBS29 TaxID=2886690 RepID=UPI001D0F8388|nr:hypothetical protein [Pusillimonas sp. MFBS29]MCC2597544.1 hypothetical protein [Pusillimonas sp. MFBS29]